MATDKKIQGKAHGKFFVALRNGVIKRKPCEKCGNPKADAHHEDYNKPLEVIWLCRSCHVRRHAEIRKELGMVLVPLAIPETGRDRECVIPD